MFKIFLSLWLTLGTSLAPTLNTLKPQPSSSQNLQLAVISDVHIDTTMPDVSEKFANALKDLNQVAPQLDIIAVNGDLTNFGYVEEYDLFNSIFKSNKSPNAESFIAIGNHEFRDQSATEAQLKNRFLTKMNVTNLYYDQWVNGYHFITIAGEKSARTMEEEYGATEKDSAYISDEQYQWLESTLAEDAAADKPIFVFFHQPITNTVYGSEYGAGLDDQKLLSLFKKYPQVILFSGHSHYPLNNEKSILKDGITMVNTSSIAYTYTPEDGDNYQQSQGYVINVYNDKVEIKAREFSNSTWIKTVTIPLSEANDTQQTRPTSLSKDYKNFYAFISKLKMLMLIH
jgi:3',5'-cyclic AMP phosphodiesterase CpdA